jgi:hypothetical protein
MAWHNAGTKTLAAFLHTDTNYVTNGATASYQFDCIGYDFAAVDVMLSPSNTTSNAPSLVMLSETDTTTSSTSGDIIAFTGKTSTATNVGFLIPQTGVLTTTGAANIYRFNVDLRRRKRYLTIRVSPVTTQAISADIRLSKPEGWPINATGVGVQALAEG